jgi:hypothetical protein
MNIRLTRYLTIAAMTAVLAPSGRAQGPFFESRERRVLARFDSDGDKMLNAAERKAAMDSLGRSGFRRGFPRRNAGQAPAKITPASVRSIPVSVPFYDPATLRTLFFEFEDDNWESELMAFKETDIEVPATLIVDGKTYKDVGVQFRGNSSFSMVPEGQKHSLNVSMDAFVKDQSLLGFNTLNLLNSHADPSYLHGVLYLQAARELIPAPRANYVRVVINGESWGIYPNIEQVNKVFLKEWYKTDAGSRWKAPGSLNGRAGLEYWGEEPARYKRTYEIKTKDDPKAWAALINLTRVLNTTPPDKLEAALTPILDIDGVMRFLALDNTLVNNDGYWVRASDYFLYLDPGGKFHITPNDINEAFGGVGGGFPMHSGPAGPDPLVGLNDPIKPLRSKLFAVPALRAKYLAYTRQIATKWLDWKELEPIAAKYRALIAADVKADTRKIYSFAEFEAGPAELRQLIGQRRELILNYPQR